MLCRSLPALSEWFIYYNAQGHDWIIVRWKNIDPSKLVLADVVVPELIFNGYKISNRFTSRTAALRKSATLCEKIVGSTEENHMGVWCWKHGNDTHYQSVFPLEAWNAWKNQSIPHDRSNSVGSALGFSDLSRLTNTGSDQIELGLTGLTKFSTQELESMQKELNSQKSGLRELITGELMRRYQVHGKYEPTSVYSIGPEPVWNEDLEILSENSQTIPTVKVEIDITITEAKAEKKQPVTEDIPTDCFPLKESKPKKRAWWQFWIPKK